MRVLKFKINSKLTRVRSYLKNVPKNLLKKMFNMKEYESHFKDYAKAKKLIFKFVFDERNKTIRSIDQYSPYWHGIFKNEKLELEFKENNQNNYECKTSTWYSIGGMYATVLYDYRVYLSLPTGGMVIKPAVYIAYPHKVDKDPKFKLCDDFHIVMDCVYSKEEALSFTTGLDDKIVKQIMNKSNMKKALDILSKGPKKNKAFFSRRVQNYEKFFQFDEKYDLVKLAKYLNEIVYELLKDDNGTIFVTKIYFKKFIIQFYQLYAIHHKITFAESLLQVLKILKLSGNKIIEDIKYPIEPEESFKQN